MKLTSIKKLSFLVVLLSSIAFSHTALALKDTRPWVKETYEGGGDGAGTLQGQERTKLEGEGKKPQDDGKKPQDDGKKPQDDGKKPLEDGKVSLFEQAKVRVSKVFKMPLDDMKVKFGKEFVDQAILMEMMAMNLGMDNMGRAPSTEEERIFIDANRNAIDKLNKGTPNITTKQETMTK
tara:strand:- start:23629 stop:24165 length:537 start_codon:yes stop_codon:yes gene_type:complete